jgi:hypothetical protein
MRKSGRLTIVNLASIGGSGELPQDSACQQSDYQEV